jgi:uncharacterized protein YjiS (DUF1127 family)
MRSTISFPHGLALHRRAPHFTSWIDSLTSRFARWRSHARELHELAQMSDRELHDIGITRLDAQAFARGLKPLTR